MKASKGNSRQQPYAPPHQQPQPTQEHHPATLHPEQTQESQEQQQSQEQMQTQRQKKWVDKMKSLVNKPVSWLRSSQSSLIDLDTTTATFLSNPTSSSERDTRSPVLRVETQLREERVHREIASTGVTDLEQNKLYPSLSEYLSTEAGQQYSHEELAAAMTPARIERRMRLRRELRGSLRGVPIPPQPEDTSESATRETNVQSANIGIEGVYSNVPLSPGEVNIIMNKRRQPTATNPEDLRRLEECLPNIHSSFNQLPRQQCARVISLNQGTQTSESPFEREAYPEGADVSNAKDEEEGSLMRKKHKRARSLPLCPKCEQPVTMKSGKRKSDRLPTPVPEDHPVGQSSQDAEDRPKKKRNIRVIPGRFSALDSSDEEENQREFDRKQAQRRLKGRKLHNSRIDEVVEWTHDKDWKLASLETWRCLTCDQRTRKTETKCKFCNAPQPGPLVLNTTPIWVLRAIEQRNNKTKEPSTPSVPISTSNFAPSSPNPNAPISSPISATLAALLPPSSHAATGSSIGSSPLSSTSTATAPTFIAASATTTAPMIPHPIQQNFQFGGFNFPVPFSFFAPTQATTASVTNWSTPTNTLGLPNTGTTIAPPATSTTVAPLSFNPFAAASAAITARSASVGTSSITAAMILSSPQSVGMQGLTGPGASADVFGLNGGFSFTVGPGSSPKTRRKYSPPSGARKMYGHQAGRRC